MQYSPYRSQLRSLLIQRSKMAIVMVVVVVHVAAASLDLGRTEALYIEATASEVSGS